MTRSTDWRGLRRLGLSTCAALLCAVVLVAGAWPAQAGINVWTSHGPPGGVVSALAIDPLTPRTLYAGTGGGVFKSTDAGATWDAANAGLNTGVYSLAIDPLTPRTFYAGTFGGIFKSTDAGATWAAANAGLSDTYFSVIALAIDPLTPRTLYAVAWDSCGGPWCPPRGLGVFKSTDAGATWAAANAGLTDYTQVGALAIDPLTPRTLYAGTADGVFKSTDGAVSWQAVDFPGLPVFDPATPTTLYAVAGGVFKSRDAGGSWSALNTGLTNAEVSALAMTRRLRPDSTR